MALFWIRIYQANIHLNTQKQLLSGRKTENGENKLIRPEWVAWKVMQYISKME